MQLKRTDTYYGTYIYGVDFSKKVDEDIITELKSLWLQYQVLIFPNQTLCKEDLENFVLYFGEKCKDPYILPIEGSDYVAEVKREKNETNEIFAEGWHSDWFHMENPPKGTALYALAIPNNGGDTLFADLYQSYKDLSIDTQNFLKNNHGVNSASRGYAPDGRYGINDKDRSMNLIYSDQAYETQTHPLAKQHPETFIYVINCNRGYTIGIENVSNDGSQDILQKLFDHQKKDKYIYCHRWKEKELVLWDNRCVLHRATGGYQGQKRSLWRVTIK